MRKGTGRHVPALIGVGLVFVVGGAAPGRAVTGDVSFLPEAQWLRVRSFDPDAAGKCLDVEDWGRGYNLQMWWCHDGGNQRFWISGGGGKWTADAGLVHTIQVDTGGCIDGFRGR